VRGEYGSKGSSPEVRACAHILPRALPKRPCAIAITADGQTILAADKFGDVFAFPLLPEPAPTAPKPSLAPPAGPTESPKPAQPFKPEADLSTVHSKKNRQALANQLRSASGNQPRFRQDAPQYTPVLGHVSMLTSIVVAASGSGRPCIITADRDEHIRVSRGLPQAHVIETYCLGHRHFVSRLCIPPQRPDMLVSGGGDDELFVWNWAAGRLVSTANLLGPVKKIHPSATRLAVLGIYASPPPAEDTSAHGAGCRVDVLCER
jgi:tRNA (guanine-N(7)-)-methyltransferase subunit TRM82